MAKLKLEIWIVLVLFSVIPLTVLLRFTHGKLSPSRLHFYVRQRTLSNLDNIRGSVNTDNTRVIGSMVSITEANGAIAAANDLLNWSQKSYGPKSGLFQSQMPQNNLQQQTISRISQKSLNHQQKRSVNGPRKLLLVCVFSGGTSPVAKTESVNNNDSISLESGSTSGGDRIFGTNRRVNAQVHSWAGGTDIYYVTHANISTRNTIVLPTEAESGGYKGIWKKTLLLFHHIATTPLGQQYDYIMKCDDDTYVNLSQLRLLLKSMDSSVPFQLGNNGYGIGCKGPAPTSPFYRQDRGTKPCHGGAGYLLSHSLVDLVGVRFKECIQDWPQSSYEDAKLSYCLMKYAAVNCIGLKQDFGWDRYHNAQRDKVGSKLENLERKPLEFAMGVTFHPVPPQYQAVIHDRLQALRSQYSTEILSYTEQQLQTTHRYLVSQWNCTLQIAVGSRQQMNALCQRYILRGKQSDALQLRESHGNTMYSELSQISIGQSRRNDSIVIDLCSWNISNNHASHRQLQLLLQSINAACAQNVRIYLLTDIASLPIAENLSSSDVATNLHVVHCDTSVRFANSSHSKRVERFLQQYGKYIDNVAVCRPHAVFQRDPFKYIPFGSGLAVFMTDDFNLNLTTHKPSTKFVLSRLGVCNVKDKRAFMRDIESVSAFRGPGLVDTGFFIGTSDAMYDLYSIWSREYEKMDSQFTSTCTERQKLSRLIWESHIALKAPVVIPLPQHSPVINVHTNTKHLWSVRHGLIQNNQSHVAAVVLAKSTCFCCTNTTALSLGYTSRGSSFSNPCISAALASVSSNSIE